MDKFVLHQVVFVKSLNKEGVVVGIRKTFVVGKPIAITYQVAISVPSPSSPYHSGCVVEFIGNKNEYVTVTESDLIRIEDAPMPTYHAEDLTQYIKVDSKSQENYLELYDKMTSLAKYPECECGKDKHGFAKHSDWCPKYV